VTLPGIEKEGWARVGIPLREKNQGISSSGIGDTGGGILLVPLIKFVRACSRSDVHSREMRSDRGYA